MHRTLFTPSMIEAFRTCKRAYELGYVRFSSGAQSGSLVSTCKRFVLRTLSEINRTKLANTQQVQKFLGQSWPLDKASDSSVEKDECTRAFLFAMKSLTRYVAKPYRPDGAEVVAVALKLRARVAHVRVYIEDTVDLVLWHPSEKRLELVNFQMQAYKPLNPAWPGVSSVVKAHLAERLKVRWPFEKLSITNYRVGTQEYAPSTVLVDEALYRLHWQDIVKDLEEMKHVSTKETQCSSSNGLCRYCAAMKKMSVFETLSGYTPNSISA